MMMADLGRYESATPTRKCTSWRGWTVVVGFSWYVSFGFEVCSRSASRR
jgi:hypothetical protein